MRQRDLVLGYRRRRQRRLRRARECVNGRRGVAVLSRGSCRCAVLWMSRTRSWCLNHLTFTGVDAKGELMPTGLVSVGEQEEMRSMAAQVQEAA